MANTGNTQQQINYGASANDGQGDPLRTAFIKTDDNFDNVWLAGPVGSNITIGNNTIQSNNTNGNIILKPNGTGIVQANASIIPNADGVRDLGTSAQAWRRAYINELLPEDLTVSGDAVINGNLTVQGDTIQIGNITTDTLTIQLANTAANAASANGAGITVGASDNIATILYNSTANRWNVSVGMSAVGNISAPFFSGNGSLLTGVVGNYGNASVVANLAALASNPVSTTGNVTAGNILTGGLISATGNITAGNLTVGSGTINGGNVNGANFNGNVAFGTGTVGGSGNITGGNISAIGNISGGNLSLSGNITSDIGFTGATISINNAPGGVEGAEIRWALPSAANTVLNTSLIQDVYQNGMRFFEAGGNSRGLYMDLGNVPNGSGTAVGYRDIPQVSFTGNATLAATDAGRHYYSTLATANTLTIANNTSVSWAVGTAITVVNRGSGTITIAQDTGVSLYLAGNSSAGNRTIATYGMATLLNVAANVWMINGSQVT